MTAATILTPSVPFDLLVAMAQSVARHGYVANIELPVMTADDAAILNLLLRAELLRLNQA
jgi:hypothetical protein